MKTPHIITLIRGDVTPKFNPKTGDYETAESTRTVVPCLVNKVVTAKVFEEYGNRTDVVIAVRFQQAQTPFQQAEFNGMTFEPLEEIDVPIKGAVRLRKVGKT